MKYLAKYWAGLYPILVDGRIEMDDNTVERTIRPIALNCENALFAGHDAGNWETIELHAYQTATLRHRQRA